VKANTRRRVGDGGADFIAALLVVSLIGELAIFTMVVHAMVK